MNSTKTRPTKKKPKNNEQGIGEQENAEQETNEDETDEYLVVSAHHTDNTADLAYRFNVHCKFCVVVTPLRYEIDAFHGHDSSSSAKLLHTKPNDTFHPSSSGRLGVSSLPPHS